MTMHPCLAVHEIVELVVGFAEDDYYCFSVGNSTPPSLTLLQTCRSFYEAGCNARWKHLDRFEPLLRLFTPNPAVSNGHPLSFEVCFL